MGSLEPYDEVGRDDEPADKASDANIEEEAAPCQRLVPNMHHSVADARFSAYTRATRATLCSDGARFDACLSVYLCPRVHRIL
eukprot:1239383-Pleurochrysis_carterae.AAC.4